MLGLILGSTSANATADLARPLAGAPLLVRQIEWLSRAGVDHVVVNRVLDGALPEDLHSSNLARTGVRVTWIPTGAALDEAELARRGDTSDDPVVVISHATLGDIDLTPLLDSAQSGSVAVQLTSDNASIRVLARSSLGGAAEQRESTGWLACVDTEAKSQELTEAILLGAQRGVVVHGTEVAPGIWRARGAVVVEGAALLAPCLLGSRCFVAEGAIAGPGAVVGDQGVLESGASLVHGRIDAGVIVGQGVDVANSCVIDGSVVRHGGRAVDIDDSLLIGRDALPARLPRLLAAVALGAVAPLSVLVGSPADVVYRRLARVVSGRGQWLGVREAHDEDSVLVDLMPVLVPPHAEDEERLAAQALYDSKKSYSTDAKLLLGRVLGAAASQNEERA